MSTEGQRPGVLVVDDQPNMCWVLGKVLGDAGFAVTGAASSRQALELYSKDRHHVVVIDYRLPDGDGLQLFGRLCEIDPRCRAVLMTSYGSDELEEQALRAGVFAYLGKPFENHTLIELTRAATGGTRDPEGQERIPESLRPLGNGGVVDH